MNIADADWFVRPGFMPHIHCYLGNLPLIGTMFTTDFLIGASYMGIAVILWFLARKIRIEFSPVALFFGIFIGACGLTHLMEVWTLWRPHYWLAAQIKVLTAIASVGTGIYLYKLRGTIIAVAEASRLSEQRRLDLEILTKNLERRAQERTAELLQSEERFTATFSQAAVGLAHIGLSGQWLRVNQKFCQMLGYSEDELKSRAFDKLNQVADGQNDREQLNAMLDGEKQTYSSNKQYIRKDGSTTWVNLTVSLVRNADGAPAYFLVVAKDINDQKKIEDDLRRAKEEAVHANELKSAFLANMSHEIRTPLGSMLGFADLLHDPNLNPAEHESYVDILIRNGEQLSVIINDILDLSKVESGQLVLELTEIDPVRIAEDVVSLFHFKAREKGVAIECRKEAAPLASLVSDPVRVRQVLMNLVGNALKFTQNGSIIITVAEAPAESSSATQDQKRPRQVIYEVKDTGIGIPRDRWESVFEMFVQADNSTTRRFGGTGLGLALSRRLARELGGDVSIVESVPGGGSTFRFSIVDQPASSAIHPSERRAEKKDLALQKDSLAGVRVLVVDDAADNRHLLWLYLSRYGAAVEFASDGLEGYEKAMNGKFDIVLMDIQMPVMDGYTSTEKLRGHGFRKPIIALTAHAMAEVREKCIASGFDDHLTKPIDKAALIHEVYQLARHG